MRPGAGVATQVQSVGAAPQRASPRPDRPAEGSRRPATPVQPRWMVEGVFRAACVGVVGLALLGCGVGPPAGWPPVGWPPIGWPEPDSDVDTADSDVDTADSGLDTADSGLDTADSDTADSDLDTADSDVDTADSDVDTADSDVDTAEDTAEPEDEPVGPPGRCVGDTSDPTDRDRDGLPDALEQGIGASPLRSDTDGDGLDDRLDFLFGRVDDPDPDADGLADETEYRHGTRSDDADSDLDGASDAREIAFGTDARVADTGTPGTPRAGLRLPTNHRIRGTPTTRTGRSTGRPPRSGAAPRPPHRPTPDSSPAGRTAARAPHPTTAHVLRGFSAPARPSRRAPSRSPPSRGVTTRQRAPGSVRSNPPPMGRSSIRRRRSWSFTRTFGGGCGPGAAAIWPPPATSSTSGPVSG
jgi:hypothetical protein